MAIINWDEPPTPQQRYRVKHRDTVNAAERLYYHEHKTKITQARKIIRTEKRATKLKNIAILDFETDPFDNVSKAVIHPFAACLYSDQFETVIIWEEDRKTFEQKVIAAILALPDAFVIYAHNGGKFDFMFLIHCLRGKIKFKGRGIMSAFVGPHELRDSFHIIPERLANFHKETFDYENMRRERRGKLRERIIEYMKSDCVYLFDIVKSFVGEFGLKLSIGQAALSELRKSYKVARVTEWSDDALRPFYFGGRVECVAGRGVFSGSYRLFDVNSMYPYVMASSRHPIGNNYVRRLGQPNDYTCFVAVTCRNYGAFMSRLLDQTVTMESRRGAFWVSIHEYNAAIECDLIDDVDVKWCIDCEAFTTFDKFVLPIYDKRLQTKARLKRLEKTAYGTREYFDTRKEDMFLKFLLNNAYGKFSQNPRKYKESYVTAKNERPDDDGYGPLPKFENSTYAIWEKPSLPLRFFNVGTGASITGAARATLLRALSTAVEPIYCDTDSIICKELNNVELHNEKLGAWKIEAEFSEVVIAGKKLYAARHMDSAPDGRVRYNVKSKGSNPWLDDKTGLVLDGDAAIAEMKSFLTGHQIEIINRGPTLTKRGTQDYLSRTLRATGPVGPSELYMRLNA